MNIQQRRRLSAIVFLTGLAAITAGCAQKTIVGKWSGTASTPGGGPTANISEDLKADGTATIVMSLMGRSFTIPGTYTAENGTLTLITSNGKNNGRSMSQTFTYKLDGDTLTLNSAHEPAPIVLKRQP